MTDRGTPDDSTTQLQGWIERLRAGEETARDELIGHACERLRRLTRRMYHDFERVHQWEDTDDVLQNATIRLLRALRTVAPASVGEFFALAARQIRRELLDLARHYYGPHGPGTRRAGAGEPQDTDSTARPLEEHPDTLNEPGKIEEWCEFHRQVETLPAREREVFNLLWYHGMTQAEAAAVLRVSEPTVKRSWLAARLYLQESLKGHEPSA